MSIKSRNFGPEVVGLRIKMKMKPAEEAHRQAGSFKIEFPAFSAM
jgi:hypothetical protein